MGAGILPVAFYNGSFHFLFSREYQTNNKIDWRDFGGGKENKESKKQTAIRECWEETDGFLGTQQDIKKLIEQKTFYTIKTKNLFYIYCKYSL